jgi:fluoroacetyl-CoA thioesterase
MEKLNPGMKGTFQLKIERKHCTSRGGPWIFSTPEMVLFSERSCHQLVAPMLAAGENREGQTARAEVELTEVDRRRLKFKVNLFDELEKIGECEHERFVIDVAKAGERLKAKMEKLGIRMPGQ